MCQANVDWPRTQQDLLKFANTSFYNFVIQIYLRSVNYLKYIVGVSCFQFAGVNMLMYNTDRLCLMVKNNSHSQHILEEKASSFFRTSEIDVEWKQSENHQKILISLLSLLSDYECYTSNSVCSRTERA